MSIVENLKLVKSSLPADVTLVAVSKTKPVDDIWQAYNVGQRHFGENKVQEMVDKYHELPKDIFWHMIGHLQTNKIKYIVEFVHLIHSVDSVKLLNKIEKEASKVNRTVNCLLQFHVAKEETKFGFAVSEIQDLIEQGYFDNLKFVNICGVMGMATNTGDNAVVASEFHEIKELFTNLKQKYFNYDSFNTISMGMSHDYKIAIEEGSNMVRVGSSIFGARNYSK